MSDWRWEHLTRTPLHHTAPAVVDECTRLREAGDWAGACRAAGLTPAVDLADVAVTFGGSAALRIAEDLRHLAPDLLGAYLATGYRSWPQWTRLVVLTRQASIHRAVPAYPYDYGKERKRLLGLLDGPVLVITGPASSAEDRGAHLGVTDASRLPGYWTPLPVWCWRADAVAERRAAYAARHPETLSDAAYLEPGPMSAHDLHPLVFEAVRPGQTRRPSVPHWDFPEVRVRCTTVWHRMRVADGRLDALDHTPQEIRRELALGALGGRIQGCAAALRAWQTGHGRLPKRLRWQRADLFHAARRGRTDLVVSMLDAGFDPAVAEGSGGTLLHVLSHLDHQVLLPRLLAAGLPVDGRDKEGATPLHRAEEALADDLAAALRAAGADPGATDLAGRVPAARRLLPRYEIVAQVRRPSASPRS
ncbi:ankyrin repeat domain-containing protein [Catellatospora sp. NPDC049609]|uniref:ankyrin repeat domain-containing protein n=1 Tax=Catellatospora sp. NPDC049609 TaxID=3155505 RepID=UPI0034274C76